MKDLNKLIVPALVALVVAVGVVYFQSSPTVIVMDKDGKEIVVGAFPGPEISNPFLSVNNVKTDYRSTGINQASTTLCSFISPAATSTLIFASINMQVATGSAIVLDIGKATLMDATTTLLSTKFTLAANTLGTIAASSSATTIPDWIFEPSRRLNFKYGGSGGTLTGADKSNDNVFTGQCKAEFIVN